MENKKLSVNVREASMNDVPALVELNRIAYPELASGPDFWTAEHFKSHIKIFPQGQLVAEIDEKIVGAADSLVIDLGTDPLRFHTWAGITDSGYFTNHNLYANTLYGADIYVHPDYRRHGVGSALYEARRQLCKRLNKRRILAGGRLRGYSNYAKQMTADEYVEKVFSKELSDMVLSFQLKEGFTIRCVLPNYLYDPDSCNYAGLIEWINPNFSPGISGIHKVRIACVQYQMRQVKSFAEFARQVSYFIDVAASYGSDFVLLPELFTMQLLSFSSEATPHEAIRKLTTYTDRFKELMRHLAQRYNMTIIAGSHPSYEGNLLYNISYICMPNGDIAEQPKLHITPDEKRWWGIAGGKNLSVIETPKGKIGVLICYDIEFPIAAKYLVEEGAEIIFVPFSTDNRQSYLRVRYCAQARAVENQIYVAMAGNVGNLPDVTNMDIQYAQSAILTPSDFEFSRDGIRAEAEPNEETIVVCDLNLDDLHRMHSEGSVTPRLDTRSDLFRIVSMMPNVRYESE